MNANHVPTIQGYLKRRNIPVSQLVKQMGIARNTFYYQLKKNHPDQDFIYKFDEATGDSLVHLISTSVEKSGQQLAGFVPNGRFIGDINETEFENGSRFRPLGNDWFMMKVDLVTNDKAQAGLLRGFADPEYQENVQSIEVPVDFVAKGNYLAFVVKGDSMFDGTIDSIPENSWVIGRELPQHQWKPRLYNHEWPTWVFVHRTEGVIIKQIAEQNLEEGWIKYHSLNPMYKDDTIYLKDILKIFNVVKRILPY